MGDDEGTDAARPAAPRRGPSPTRATVIGATLLLHHRTTTSEETP